MTRRRVVITGMGMVTPCGIGVEPTWDAIVHGRSGIAPIMRFDASPMETRFAGELKGFVPENFMDRKQARRVDRYQQFALAAADMAMRDAGFVIGSGDATRAAVVVGTCVAGLASTQHEYLNALPASPGKVSPFFILGILGNMAASYLSIRYGFKGPNWSINSACSTSSHALGEACRLIQRGEIDVALAGGAESPICFMGIAAFNAIRALSTRNDDPQGASRPFDADRDGFVLSEGGAILLLEELEHARARGARVHAELTGYGASSDAFHITAPGPGHEGAQRCMRSALADAGIGPDAIDYINAHGTSTPIGDTAEVVAIEAVFGDRARTLPVSSTKSMTGHLTGAAGATEAIFGVLALRDQILPPTINLHTLDPAVALDCVPNVARPARLETVMSNSFGFGGTNSSLVLRRMSVDEI